MANPVIGNSLFAIVLALMHVPPMFALLWAQRRLRSRMPVVAAPIQSVERTQGSLSVTVPMLAPPSRG